MADDFIGRGWSFPVRTDSTGNVALSAGAQDIDEAVRIILGTAPGERPMRPSFGCGIQDLVFAPVDAALAGRIAYEVRASLERWEPRIEVEEVEVTVDDDDPSVLYIELGYLVRATSDKRNLVFPFYTIPGER